MVEALPMLLHLFEIGQAAFTPLIELFRLSKYIVDPAKSQPLNNRNFGGAVSPKRIHGHQKDEKNDPYRRKGKNNRKAQH